MLPDHLVLHLALELPLVIVHFFVICLSEKYLSCKFVQFHCDDVLLGLLEAHLHIVFVLAEGDMLIIDLPELNTFFSPLCQVLL